ncbi:MAG: ATPase [Eubacterium sp.]|nr:ATPase [Eubacterium sp.]
MLIQQLRSEQESIESEIKKIQQQIQQLPKGHLICLRNGVYVNWFSSESGQKQYIQRKNRAFAEQLAHKKYLTAHLQDLIQEQKAIHSYLKNYQDDQSYVEKLIHNPLYEDILSNCIKPVSEELRQWMTQEYMTNTSYPERLRYKSITGNVLRSKSEVFIEQALYERGIPYRYECALQLGTIIVYPDFTLRHPSSGKKCYWEHNGRMDDTDYVRKVGWKMETYSRNKIYPDVNLINTYETELCPLNPMDVQQKINWFLERFA